MSEIVELLFFDTFAHENSEELNLDLVQFPKPVFVTEVRIIPLGARVQADFPGGVRLGATNPSQFSIEFFVNDLGKPGASTFESLGGFDYDQNGCINLECVPNDSIRKIPTDGLVLRGWYTTITLAVYGILTTNIAEQIIAPVVTPSLPAQPNPVTDVQQIIQTNPIENEWPQDNIRGVSLEYAQQATAYPQAYAPPEQYPQEYTEYYNEVPKDPRSYHHTPEPEWDSKSRGRSIEHDRDRERGREVDRYQKSVNLDHEHRNDRLDNERRDRDRHYSRSHSRDRDRPRDYRETSRDRERDRERDRDWDHERSQNLDYRDRCDKDWDRDRDRDRSYKHQESYRRSYGREDREDVRKRPRTPPLGSPKRPHTPHGERTELSPPEIESFSEDEYILEKQKRERECHDSTHPPAKPFTVKSPPQENQETSTPPVEEISPMDVEEFEPILSDEDILDDSEHFSEMDYDYAAYTNNDSLIKLFVPGNTELQKYKKSEIFLISDNKIEVDNDLKITISITDDFFRSSITKYIANEFKNLNNEIKEEFIHLCEKVTSTIGNTEHFCNIVKLYNAIQNIKCNKFNADERELVTQAKTITETVLDWAVIALDFEMANAQNQPGYKIRHIKCGVRLIDWCCNSVEFIYLLWSRNVHIHDVLLSLYEQEYMALSIKLMILRALDTYLLNKPAIESFITGKCFNEIPKENGYLDSLPLVKTNGYKTLVEIFRQNPSVRLKFSLNSILKKINLYEVLYKLHRSAAKLRNNCNEKLLSSNINFMLNMLDQILDMYQSGYFTVSQPKRFLPVTAQFEINRNETKNVFIKLFEMHGLLECFVLLLTHPDTMNLTSVKTPIYELLSELLRGEDGLEYLSSNYETVNLLLRCLLQNEEDIQFSLPDSMEVKSHILGLRIAYKLQCLYHIEYLLDVAQKWKYDCDATEIIDHLHAMFCLTFSNVGRVACAEMLGLNNNIKCLLQFVDILNTKEKSDWQLSKLKKSPGVGYVIDLIAYTIIFVPNIKLLENYSKQLLHIVNQQELFETTVAVKINEFAPFVKPFENVSVLNYDSITSFVDTVLKHTDSVTMFPGQLITCLRILEHLGVSKHNITTSVAPENLIDNYVELKYKHVILQLYSLDGIAMLTKILQKMNEYYEQPNLHTTSFISNQGVYIVSTIQPCINLLKHMLRYVIQCRNTNFKDLTTIPVLLQTYNLLRSFPSNCLTYFMAKKICENLLETLLVYTQPISDEVNEKDSLNKMLWTLMCGEVIKYTTTAPYTFISGLSMFSELLPLPLPIQTCEPLTSEEILWAVNLRKLWSAHLHTHSASIQDLINRMCTSTHQPLLNLLRRVCVQLSDLAANSAIMIARGILDTVHSALIPKEDSKLQLCSANTARLLNFLACLVTHGSLKCAVLQLLNPNNATLSKGDEKYPILIQAFSQILKTSSSSNSHIQAQECILSIIQSFCDTEITLLQNSAEDKSDVNSDIYLANSLPAKDNLLVFISTIVEHLVADNSFLTYLPILRTLLLLTEHDYGFYHLRENLIRKSEVFINILNKLVKNFSKDSAECLSTLNTVLEFFRLCATLEEVEGPIMFIPRSMKMSINEIKTLVGLKFLDDDEIDKSHPIFPLENLLKKISQDDKTFESLLEDVTSVITLLSTNAVNDAKESYSEPILPAPESLLVQFAKRQVFTCSDIADDRLTSVYWLSAPSDEVDNDNETVSCDLTEICRQHLPVEVNLVREVEKLCRVCPSENTEQDDPKIKGVGSLKDKIKKPFVTPMARRGFPRSIQVRADLFRSRPPNTSRPPSLHVDDFVALETCGAQPTGPTGYNKISRELLATSRVTRGSRGRAFVTSERAVQYRQMSWWGAGIGRGPYQ